MLNCRKRGSSGGSPTALICSLLEKSFDASMVTVGLSSQLKQSISLLLPDDQKDDSTALDAKTKDLFNSALQKAGLSCGMSVIILR